MIASDMHINANVTCTAPRAQRFPLPPSRQKNPWKQHDLSRHDQTRCWSLTGHHAH